MFYGFTPLAIIIIITSSSSPILVFSNHFHHA